MLVIRLFRVGKKNQPSFKIVVTDKKKASRRGRFVEEVGFYNPLTKEKVLRNERIKYWLSVGAKPSDTIHNLLISEKIIEGEKIDVHKKTKKSAKTTSVPVATPITPIAEKPIEVSVPPAPEKSASTEVAADKPVEEKPAEEPKNETPVPETPK